jgi:hypothetical protein
MTYKFDIDISIKNVNTYKGTWRLKHRRILN